MAQSVYRESLKDIPEFTYYKALERMVERNKLLRLTKGIYLRSSYQTGEAEIVQEIIRYYTAAAGKYVAGVQTGAYLLEKYGLRCAAAAGETQEVRIYTSRIAEQRKTVSGVALKKLPCRLDKVQKSHLEAMEILSYYEVEEKRAGFDMAKLQEYLAGFAAEYEDAVMVDLLKKKPYPKHTIAFLKQVLEREGIENRLGEFLAGTSRYRIPELVG